MSSAGDKLTQSQLQEGPQGFAESLKMIRPAAWVIAIIFFFGMQALFHFVVWPYSDPNEMARTPEALKWCLPIFVGAILATFVLLVGYVYVDSKRRGMRYVMWTLLSIFIPNMIGIILYFLLRDPMPTPCPKCGRMVRAGFAFCPSCGTELLRACKACHRKLEPGWVNCAYCGTPTGAQAPRTP
jgi:RNA polymerase subunit RPABC4/transcription elongation factor Spt4